MLQFSFLIRIKLNNFFGVGLWETFSPTAVAHALEHVKCGDNKGFITYH